MTTIRQQILNIARSIIGLPYIYGAESPDKGFDCSHFFHYCYGSQYHSLPYMDCLEISKFYSAYTKPLVNIQPGDILLYNQPVSHLMICLNVWSNHVVIACGARGGDSTTTTIDAARAKGACVGVYPNYWPLCLNKVIDPLKMLGE
jgi:cell wall-associated NlpC family hydrolase